MTVKFRIAVFVAAMAIVAAGAALAGAAIEPRGDTGAADDERSGHAAGENDEAMGAHDAPDPVRGLAVAQDGLRVVVDDPELRRGAAERLRFRIVDASGETVRDFDVEHEKRMHLIVARRDLATFQHLHPEQGADGAWRTGVRLDEAGSYRLFADFSREGKAHTLATDLRVDGAADLQPLPAPQDTAVSGGGYDVRLDVLPRAARSSPLRSAAHPGEESQLRFTITKDGAPVETEPYLGAGGHLVALREGDLAFLHVHPGDDGVVFDTTFETAGRYRLFLQFKHEGRVRTVAFTREVR
jgi:hypothetical protein